MNKLTERERREEAAKRGQSTYSSASVCRRGHIGLRYVRNGYCVQCQAARNEANRGHFKALLEQAKAAKS